MHFDVRLWRMTRGLRGRIALSILIGLLALAIGIARFAFLGQFLARLFRGAPTAHLVVPLVGALAAILLRPWLDHVRTMVAHRTATRVQKALRGRLYDKIVALGPAWFGAERTGGVMLSIIDGVEQLQTFFGQYLPQVAIAVCTPVAIFAFIAFWDVPVAAVMLGATLFTLMAPAVVPTESEDRLVKVAPVISTPVIVNVFASLSVVTLSEPPLNKLTPLKSLVATLLTYCAKVLNSC